MTSEDIRKEITRRNEYMTKAATDRMVLVVFSSLKETNENFDCGTSKESYKPKRKIKFVAGEYHHERNAGTP